MNKVFLTGTIQEKLELKSTQQGTLYTKLMLVVPRRHNEEKHDFIPCTAWAATAEEICRKYQKDDLICVEGGIRTTSWSDAQGQKHYEVSVLIEDIHNVAGRRINDSYAEDDDFAGEN